MKILLGIIATTTVCVSLVILILAGGAARAGRKDAALALYPVGMAFMGITLLLMSWSDLA